MIGAAIGPGGKIIQKPCATELLLLLLKKDKGIVSVAADNKDVINMALARINGIVAIPEVGKTYTGKVVNSTLGAC